MTTFEIDRALTDGDFGALSAEQRASHYGAVCDSLGLNALTRPLEYIELNGKLTLYAKRDATDQLRRMHHVTVEILDRAVHEDVYIVRARATLPDGRADESLGAVSIGGLEGSALGNALMTAETKAKRRVTLSICGLGFLDETEVATLGAHAATARAVARGTASDAAPTAADVLRLWDLRESEDRTALYAHVKQTYRKRVVALTSREVDEVLAWIKQRRPNSEPQTGDDDREGDDRVA